MRVKGHCSKQYLRLEDRELNVIESCANVFLDEPLVNFVFYSPICRPRKRGYICAMLLTNVCLNCGAKQIQKFQMIRFMIRFKVSLHFPNYADCISS